MYMMLLLILVIFNGISFVLTRTIAFAFNIFLSSFQFLHDYNLCLKWSSERNYSFNLVSTGLLIFGACPVLLAY